MKGQGPELHFGAQICVEVALVVDLARGDVAGGAADSLANLTLAKMHAMCPNPATAGVAGAIEGVWWGGAVCVTVAGVALGWHVYVPVNVQAAAHDDVRVVDGGAGVACLASF